MNAAENTWQWIVTNKEITWEILRHIPLREIIASTLIGTACGLFIDTVICAVLQKTALNKTLGEMTDANIVYSRVFPNYLVANI